MSREGMWLVAWIGVLAAGGVLPARQPTFRSGVDLVTIDAAVHDADGRPVGSLRAEDFRLEVDGRQRPIAAAQFLSLQGLVDSPKPLSATHFSSNEGDAVGRVMVIAVDEAHIRRLEGRGALAAIARSIDALPAADRVGVIGLTGAGPLTLTRDRSESRRRLDRLIGSGDLLTQQLNLGLSEALEIAEGGRARLAEAVLRECGRALTEYVNTARAADDAGGGRDGCPEQVEQESRAIAQHAHMQARRSLAALEELIERLKGLPGPKTLVLVSEGMIVDPRRADLSTLVARAQAARVTIYGLQLEVPIFEAAQERVSPTMVRDRHALEDGIAQVAGAARGAVFRQAGSDPKPFERIVRELSGYYLLAFEAADRDRDGRAHRIRVTLARGGGQLRARPAFTLPPVNTQARGAQLTALLRNLAPFTELPLRVATFAAAEPASRRIRVVVSAEAGDGEASLMGFVLVDAGGVIAATASHDAADGRHAFSAVVPEGTYTLRAAAIDRLGRQGTVERIFPARLLTTAPGLRVGELMLARPSTSPTAPLEPLVDRVSGTDLVAYFEIPPGLKPRFEVVRFRVTRAGAPLVTAPAEVSSRDAGWMVARAVVPIAHLPPGAYEAAGEIVAAEGVVARVVRPFTIAAR